MVSHLVGTIDKEKLSALLSKVWRSMLSWLAGSCTKVRVCHIPGSDNLKTLLCLLSLQAQKHLACVRAGIWAALSCSISNGSKSYQIHNIRETAESTTRTFVKIVKLRSRLPMNWIFATRCKSLLLVKNFVPKTVPFLESVSYTIVSYVPRNSEMRQWPYSALIFANLNGGGMDPFAGQLIHLESSWYGSYEHRDWGWWEPPPPPPHHPTSKSSRTGKVHRVCLSRGTSNRSALAGWGTFFHVKCMFTKQCNLQHFWAQAASAGFRVRTLLQRLWQTKYGEFSSQGARAEKYQKLLQSIVFCLHFVLSKHCRKAARYIVFDPKYLTRSSNNNNNNNNNYNNNNNNNIVCICISVRCLCLWPADPAAQRRE